MSRLRSFALAAPALLVAAALAPAAPPGIVAPPNTYHYPSGRDFVSPANRSLSNYYAPPQSYYLHPYMAEPNVAPRNSPATGGDVPGYLRSNNPEPNVAPQYPPAPGTSPPPGGSPLDVPLVPRLLREPEAPPPAPAEIEVRVPAGAEIWFNGEKTRLTGAVRLFRSPPLEPGTRYGYDVKARWTEDGKSVERTLHVPVAAGSREKVSFRD